MNPSADHSHAPPQRLRWIYSLRRGLTRFVRGARSWLTRISSDNDGPASPDTVDQTQLDAVRYLVVNEICDQGHFALSRGDDTAAQDAIDRADSIDPAHPELAELRARLALHHHRPDNALSILESVHLTTPRQHLLLQFVRLQAGQRAAAHLDLTSWSRHPQCPNLARVLAAWLDSDDNDIPAARRHLQRNHQRGDDPETARLQLLLAFREDLPDARSRHAATLAYRLSHHHATPDLLQTLNLPQPDPADVPSEMIDQLAGELFHRPQTIPTLLAAQRRASQPHRIELLRRAIARIVHDLAHPLPALQALAMLAELAGDHDDAARWARHGLDIAPRSAPLAMLLNRVTQTATRDRQFQPHPRLVLHRAADAHPDWPDVQHALIRRYLHDGLNNQARLRLKRWLNRQPDHPLAQRTAKELAA